MKTGLLILFILCISLSLLSLEVTEIPIEEIQDIAMRNASEQWGEVYPDEPIPYYDRVGKIIAWQYNFSIGKPFPDREELKNHCRNAADKLWDSEWNSNEFANMLLGARTNQPVIIAYAKGLSYDYSYLTVMEKLADQNLKKPYKIEKMAFVNFGSMWFVVSDQNGEHFVKAYPPPKVLSYDEFYAATDSLETPVIPTDFTGEWNEFREGRTVGRALTYIPNHEKMPFFTWVFGCSPCSGSMLAAWWDYNSDATTEDFSLLVKYYYYDWDDVVGGTIYHIADAVGEIAGYMGTNSSGVTLDFNIDDGMQEFFEARGYDCWVDADDIWWEFMWDYGDMMAAIRSEIKNNTPCLLSIPGHTICGVGYNTTASNVETHDPNYSTMQTLSIGNFQTVYQIHPSGGWGAACKLLSPIGSTGFTTNDNGEQWNSEAMYEIAWEGDYPAGSYAKIFYNLYGGYAGDWVPITTNTPNDGSFDWYVPTDAEYEDMVRVKIEIYDSGNNLIGADASYGDFDVSPGGGVDVLSNDSSTAASDDPAYYSFNQPNQNWAVVAAHNPLDADEYDMIVFEDNTFSNMECFSNLMGDINLIAVDRNHLPDNTFGLKLYSFQGDTIGSIEYEGGNEELPLGPSTVKTWVSSDKAKIWDVELTPGTYRFNLHHVSGNGNLDMALFSSETNNYRSLYHAKAYGNSQSAGVDESFIVTITTTDRYGLCVYRPSMITYPAFSYQIIIEPPGSWIGTTSSVWTDPTNWSDGIVPDSDDDVYISDTYTYPPVINAGMSAECKSITIASSARLEIYNAVLTIHGSLDVHGTLYMGSDYSILNCHGTIHWFTGSSFEEAENGNIYVRDNWIADSSIHPAYTSLTFNGPGNSEIILNNIAISFGNLKLSKNSGYNVIFNESSNDGFVIHGDFTIDAGTDFYGMGEKTIYLKGDLTANGTLRMVETDIILGSADPQNIYCSSASYFKDFSCSGGTKNLLSNVTIKGSVSLGTGTLNANTYTMTVYGDWDSGIEINSYYGSPEAKVKFVGSQNQTVDGQNFEIIEVAKQGSAQIQVETYDYLICQSYDWTSGVVKVDGGGFIAYDLADIRVMGSYILSDGLIELYQDTSHYVDMDASLWITGGTMNIHGGFDFPSEWAYTQSTQIYMTGGVLDFVDNGIYLRSTGHFLNTYITGGTIRTSGDFKVERNGFNPIGGAIELYGSGTNYLKVNSPSTIFDVNINKTGSRNGGDETLRTDQVIVNSNTTIANDLTVSDGLLQISNCTLTIGRDLIVNGGLYMDDANEAIVAGRNITFNSGSSSTVLNGTITLGGSWAYDAASTAAVTSPATVVFSGYATSYIWAHQTQTVFGNIIVEKMGSSCVVPLMAGTAEIVINDLTIKGNSSFYTSNKTYNIAGKIDIWETGNLGVSAGALINTADFYEAGMMNMTGGIINISTNYTQYATGNNQILDGDIFINSPYTGALHAFAGITNLSGGSFQITNNGIQFGTEANFNVTNNGILKIGWGLRAPYPGTFIMSSGTVEMNGTLTATIEMAAGNQIANLTINKTGTSGNVYLMTDAYVQNSCYINSGKLYLNHHQLTVGQNFNCNGIVYADNSDDELKIGGTWYSDNGTSCLVPGSGTVTFYSPNDSQIGSDVNFYNLVINKEVSRTQTMRINSGISVSVANDLNVLNGNLTLMAASQLLVSGNLTLDYGTQLECDSSEANMTIQVGGDTDIVNTASIILNHASTVIFTGDLNVYGTLDVGNSNITLHGYLSAGSTSTISINSGQLICDAPDNSQNQIMNGVLNMTDINGLLEFTNLSLQFNSSGFNHISAGRITVGGSLDATATNVLHPGGGTFRFSGSRNSTLNCTNGNWLSSIEISKGDSTLTLVNDLLLMNGLTLSSGVLNPNTNNISCGGNWVNYAGESGYLETNSSVTMTGVGASGTAYIDSDETFNNLIIDMETEAAEFCRIAADKTVNVLNDLSIVSGVLELDNSAVLVVGNNINIASGCCLNLEAGTNASLTFEGDLIDLNTSRAEFNSLKADLTSNIMVTGSQDQEINTSTPGFRFQNLTLNKTGGIFYSYDPVTVTGDFFLTDGSWDYEISGLTHTFEGDFTVAADGNWNDNSGTVSFGGNQDSEIAIYGSCDFGNLEVNKQISTAGVDLITDWLISSPSPLTIQEGILNLNGYTLSSGDNIVVMDGGKLKLIDNSLLNMLALKSIDIQSGGVFESIGTIGNTAMISNLNGFHEFNVNSGGIISTEYTVFEKMNFAGIQIMNDAIVDLAHCLSNCEFRNGEGYGTLLTINNNQDLNIINPVFVTDVSPNESLYNVGKIVDTGTLTVYGDSGNFMGTTHESDPYMRINWSTDVPVIDIEEDELIFDTVIWSGSTEENFDINNAGSGSLFGSISIPDGFSVSHYIRGTYSDLETSEERNSSTNNRDILSFLIPAMGSATFTVTFTPDHPGIYDGDMIITHNASGGTDSIHLYGESTGPVCEIDNDNFYIELQPGGSSDFTLTVNNSGTDSLTYYADVYSYGREESRDDKNQLSRNHELIRTDWLTINDSLHISGYIEPGSPAHVFDLHVDTSGLTSGLYNAEIVFSSNDPVNFENYIYVDLSVGYPAISIMNSYLDFGNVATGTDSTQSFFIDSTGALELVGTITTPAGYSVERIDEIRYTEDSGISPLGDNTRNVLEFNIESGFSGEFAVTFTPGAVQNYADSLLVVSNGGPNLYMPLYGNGIGNPELSGVLVEDIHAQSATCSGTVTSEGGLTVLEHGFCWNTSGSPTLNDSIVVSTDSIAAFECELTGLSPSTHYYIRSFATNALGTGYGSESSFTTATPNLIVSTDTIADFGHVPIGQSSAEATFTISGENLIDMVMLSVLASSGFEVSMDYVSREMLPFSNELYLYPADETLTETTVYVRFSPLQVGHVTAPLTITTSGGNSAEVTLSGTGVTIPQVDIGIPFNISQTTAFIGGLVTDDGLDPVTDCGICWSVLENPTIAEDHTSEGFQSEWFYSELTDLASDSTYYARAYATNSAGTAYSLQTTFTTLINPALTVIDSLLGPFGNTLVGAFSIPDTLLISGERLLGDIVITAPTGFQVSLTDRFDTREFTSSVNLTPFEGIVPETTVYVRFAPEVGGNLSNPLVINTPGDSSVIVMVFGNGISLPEVTTLPASNITTTSAELGGYIDSDGYTELTETGVLTGIQPITYTLSDSTEDPALLFFEYNIEVTELAPGTTYYYVAYATNEAGTALGDELNFTTTLDAPQNLTISVVGDSLVLSWDMAVGADGYKVYSAGLISEPPGNWVLEQTIYDPSLTATFPLNPVNLSRFYFVTAFTE